MASSRLPGKVLADIAGKPALTRMVDRLRHARMLDGIVLATTTSPADDVLEDWAGKQGVACFRGSDEDVLGRVVAAHREQGTEIIVALCGDCPLIDPCLVDSAVDAFGQGIWDLVTTARDSGYPQGTEVQVMTFEALAEVAATVDDPAAREHVTLHVYEHPRRYRIGSLRAEEQWSGRDVRLQLDYPEDLAFLNALCTRLDGDNGGAYGIGEIVRAIRADPALAAINAQCRERPPR